MVGPHLEHEKLIRQVTSANIKKAESATPYPLIDISVFQGDPYVNYTYDESTDSHKVSVKRDPVELMSFSDATAVVLPDIINVSDLFIVCLSFIAINAPGRSIGIKSTTIETDTARYQIDFACVTDESEFGIGYETAVIGMGMAGLAMLRDIVESEKTRARYEGARMNMLFTINAAQREEIGRIVQLYIEAGGTNQDLGKTDMKESISVKRNPKRWWF